MTQHDAQTFPYLSVSEVTPVNQQLPISNPKPTIALLQTQDSEYLENRFVGLLSHTRWLLDNKSGDSNYDLLRRQIFSTMDDVEEDFRNLKLEVESENLTVSDDATIDGDLSVAGTTTLQTMFLSGLVYDSEGVAGSVGDVLLATATGTNWVATSTLGISGGGGGATSIEGLSDVANMTESTGDLLYWTGTEWSNIATSSLGIVGGGSSLFTDGGATTYLSSLTDTFAIGTTTTAATLSVYDASNPQLAIETGATGNADLLLYGNRLNDNNPLSRVIGYNGGDDIASLSFYRDGNDDAGSIRFLTQQNGSALSEKMRLDSLGRLAIGTTTALSRLTVSNGNLTLDGSSSNIALGDNYISGDGDDEGVFVDAFGNVGIGTTTPSRDLSVSGDVYVDGSVQSYFSTTSLNAFGFFNTVTSDPLSNGGRVGAADTFAVSETGNTTNYTYLYGLYSGANHYGVGSVAEGTGLWGEILNGESGTITDGRAISAGVYNFNAAGVIGNATGYIVEDIVNVGTISNTYGIYIGDLTSGTQTNTPYSIYASDAGALNYFAGSVGVATSTPDRELVVDGDFQLTGGLYDNNNEGGTNGQLLASTGGGIDWVATSTLGFGSGDGTVTSVAASVPTGWTVTGSPITDSGTLAFAYDTGYGAVLTASSTSWNTFYDTPSTRITAGTDLSWSGNALNFDNTSGYITGNETITLSGDVTGSGTTSITTTIAADVIDFENIDYSAFLAGNPTMGVNESFFGNAGIMFEGGTADTAEGLLIAGVNSGSDRIWTLPDKSGAITLIEDIDTSAELAAILTDETGTAGSVVFSASPTFTGNATFASLNAQDIDMNVTGSSLSPLTLTLNRSGTTGGFSTGVYVDIVDNTNFTTSNDTYGNYTSVSKNNNASADSFVYGSYNVVFNSGGTGSNDTFGVYSSASGDNDGVSNAYAYYADVGGADVNYMFYGDNSAASGDTLYGLYIDVGAGLGTEYAAVFERGNVGIGTTTPAYQLSVDASVFNEIAQFHSSDNRATIILSDDDTTNYFVSEADTLSIGGAASLQNSNLNITSTGNVGIGTTTPEVKLSVVGDQYLSGALGIGTGATGAYAINAVQNTNAGSGFFASNFNGGTAATPQVYLQSSAGVGTRFGTTPSGYTTTVIPGVNAQDTYLQTNQAELKLITSAAAGSIQFWGTGTSPSEMARFDSGGNFGIGTTSPYATLSVDGDIAFTGGIYDANNTLGALGQVLQTDGTNATWVATSTLGLGSSVSFGADNQIPYTNSSTSDFDYSAAFTFDGSVFTTSVDNAGYVASFINDGNNANREGILIQAGLDLSLSTGPNKFVQFNDGNGSDIGSITHGGRVFSINAGLDSQQFAFTTNGTEQVRIDLSGNVGIGTTTPAQKLQVFGDIRVGTSGSNGCLEDFGGTLIAGTCSSDGDLKTDITPISTGESFIERFAELDIVTYKWNQTANTLYSKSTDVENLGVIAQDVEALFPELISYDDEGYRQVDFRAFPFYIIEALKEVWEAVTGNQEKIETLEDRIEALEAELNVSVSAPAPTPESPVVDEPEEDVVEGDGDASDSDPVTEPVDPQTEEVVAEEVSEESSAETESAEEDPEPETSVTPEPEPEVPAESESTETATE